jgi:hypothetical protein
MDFQTQSKLFHLGNLIGFRLSPTLSICQTACAVPEDYGFDFDERELENELHSPSITGLSGRSIQQIEAVDFETRFRWFIS